MSIAFKIFVTSSVFMILLLGSVKLIDKYFSEVHGKEAPDNFKITVVLVILADLFCILVSALWMVWA